MVGGGAVATRRVPALLDAGADVLLVAPEISPALRAHADAGRLRWLPRRFTPDDLDGAWLVHVAVDDPAAAATVSTAADARRIFCVRADDRQAASAWTPAVTRHGPVTVAVLGGGDPRRAMTVRDAIRTLLDARKGPFLTDSVEEGPPLNTSGGAGRGRGAGRPGRRRPRRSRS